MCTRSPPAVPPLVGFLLAPHCTLPTRWFNVLAPPLSVPLLMHFHTEKRCPRKSLRKYAVVCKLNSLMTFSLEELTANCCLCLPKGWSAWLRVALLYMKYCFQATATGSYFALGERQRNEHQWMHGEISDEKKRDILSQISPPEQGLVPVWMPQGG